MKKPSVSLLLIAAIIILIAGWFAFYLSGYGILVHDGGGLKDGSMYCTYLLATRDYEIRFAYARSQQEKESIKRRYGEDAKLFCPRLYQLAQ